MRLIIVWRPNYTRGYIIDGFLYWLSPPEDHPLGEAVSNRHERLRQEAKPAMQPMLRTADDQDEGHMIGSLCQTTASHWDCSAGSRTSVSRVCSIAADHPRSATRWRLADGAMQDKWSMAISLVKFGRTV